MDVKTFDSLSPVDFENGSILDEIRSDLKELETIKSTKFFIKQPRKYCPKCGGLVIIDPQGQILACRKD